MVNRFKMRLVVIKIFIFFICLIFACDPADSRLKIINNSNENIYVHYTCDSSLNDLKIFRNGYYKNQHNDSSYVTSEKYIKLKSKVSLPKRGFKAWINYIEKCAGNKLHIFIITDSVVKKHPDEHIRRQALFEKHFKFSLLELKKMNWEIVYE